MTAPAEPQYEIFDGDVSTLPAERDSNHRVVQECSKCNVRDHHPRHSVYYPPVRDPRDPTGETLIHFGEDHHFDCGAAAGCPHCIEVMDASGNAHGHALIAHLEAQPVNGNHAGLPED